MKKLLAGLFILSILFIGIQAQAAFTTGTSNSTTTLSATDIQVCCASFGYGSNMVKTINSYKLVNKNECVYPTGLVGGGKEVVSNNLCASDVTPPVKMCDYAAPREGCSYVQGPNYDSTTGCGRVLSCSLPTVKGCLVGFNYNPETGQKCSDVLIKDGCFKGFNYSSTTGQKCSSENPSIDPNSKYGNCPLNMPNPFALCSDGKIEAKDKDKNGCTISYKCKNPSSTISLNTSNAYDTKVCPLISTPDTATFCPKGTIKSEKDSNGCVTYKCAYTKNCSNGSIWDGTSCVVEHHACSDGSTNCAETPNTTNSCPLNMPNPFALCSDGKIEAKDKDKNGCTISYKCKNPSSTISLNTSNDYDTKVCPLISTPDTATFCPKGTIGSEKDANGCVTYKCVPPPATGFIPFVTHIFGLLTNYFK